MTQSNFRNLLASLALLGNGTFAMAQAHHHAPPPNHPAPTVSAPAPVAEEAPAPTPVPYLDPHPYQSQAMIRYLPGPTLTSNMIETIPGVTVDNFYYHVPGMADAQVAKSTALLYDKRNSAPTGILAAGANYLFFKDPDGTPGAYMATTSADGFFYYQSKTSFNPQVIGGVYFTQSGTNDLVVVDSYGNYIDTFTTAPEIRWAGGNYFIDSSGNLTTIRSMGTVAPGDATNMVVKKDGWNFSDTKAAGGNFFMKGDGSIVTISSSTGYFSAPYTPDSAPKFNNGKYMVGGNYYIGNDNYIYTVAADGTFTKTDDFALSEMPTLMGYSFMQFANGHVLMIDAKGLPHDNLMNISTTGITAKPVKTLGTLIDPSSIYLPKN